MKTFLGTAGAAVLLALTSAPAQAASPTQQATATARVYRPLTITFGQNLDFGTIVLSGTGAWSGEVINLSEANSLTCGSSANVVCSGSHQVATYDLAGSADAFVTVTSPGFNLTGPGTLAFTPNFTASRQLNGSGALTIGLGGHVTVASTTPEGVYTGDFLVSADYQ